MGIRRVTVKRFSQGSGVVGGRAGQLIRYGVSAGLSAGVTLGIPVLLHEGFGVEQRIAVAISQSSALLLNFVLIRVFVFRSKRAAQRDLAYFVGSAVAFRAFEYLLFLGLFTFAHVFYVAALIATLGTSTLLKFVWYQFLFGRSPDVP